MGHPLGPEALAIELGKQLFLQFAGWVGGQLRQGYLGDSHQLALERVFRPAFTELTTWMLHELHGDTALLTHLTKEALGPFLADPEVRRELTQIVYARLSQVESADEGTAREWLRTRFAELGFDARTMGIEFDRVITQLLDGLLPRVAHDAREAGSPHFAQLVLSMLTALLDQQRPDYHSALGHYLTALLAHCDRLPYVGLPGTPLPSLSSVYVPAKARAEGQKGERSAEPIESTLPEILGRYPHVLLEGPGGIGKSTMVRSLVRELAEAALQGTSRLVPVLVPAPVLATTPGPLHKRLATIMPSRLDSDLKEPLPENFFARPPLADGRWLIIVDGLDEVLSEHAAGVPEMPADSPRFTELLQGWILEQTLPAAFVVTTRACAHSARLDKSILTHCFIRRFSTQQVAVFAERWFRVRGHEAGEAQRFMAELQARRLKQVVQIPLLLTMAAIIYEENLAQQRPSLPATRTRLYQEFLTILLDRQEGARKSRLRWVQQWEQFHGREGMEAAERIYTHLRSLLEHLAHWSYQGGQGPFSREALAYVFQQDWVPESIEDERWVEEQLQALLMRTGLIYRQGGVDSFLHQTFRDFLVARGWAKLPPETPTVAAALTGEGDVTDEMLLFYFGNWQGPLRRGERAARDATEAVRSLWLHHPKGLSLAALALGEGAPVEADLQWQILQRLLAAFHRREISDYDILSRLPVSEPLVSGVQSLVVDRRLPTRYRIRAAESLFHLEKRSEATAFLTACAQDGGTELAHRQAQDLLRQAGVPLRSRKASPPDSEFAWDARLNAIVALWRLGLIKDTEPHIDAVERAVLSSGTPERRFDLIGLFSDMGLSERAYALIEPLLHNPHDLEETARLSGRLLRLERPQEVELLWRANVHRLGRSAFRPAVRDLTQAGYREEATALVQEWVRTSPPTPTEWADILELGGRINSSLGRELAERFLIVMPPLETIEQRDLIEIIGEIQRAGLRDQALELFRTVIRRPELSPQDRYWITYKLDRLLEYDPVPDLRVMIAELSDDPHSRGLLLDMLESLISITDDAGAKEQLLRLGLDEKLSFEDRMSAASKMRRVRVRTPTILLKLCFEPSLPLHQRLQALSFALERGYRVEVDAALAQEETRSDLSVVDLAFLAVAFDQQGEKERATALYQRIKEPEGFDRYAHTAVALIKGLLEPPATLFAQHWESVQRCRPDFTKPELAKVLLSWYSICFTGNVEAIDLLIESLPADHYFLPESLLVLAAMCEHPVGFAGLFDANEELRVHLLTRLATTDSLPATAQASIRFKATTHGRFRSPFYLGLLKQSAALPTVHSHLRLAICGQLIGSTAEAEALTLAGALCAESWPGSPVGAATLQFLLEEGDGKAAAPFLTQLLPGEVAAVRNELKLINPLEMIRTTGSMHGNRMWYYWMGERLEAERPYYRSGLEEDLANPNLDPVTLLQVAARLDRPIEELESIFTRIASNPELVADSIRVCQRMAMVGFVGPSINLLKAAAPVLGWDVDLATTLVWNAGLFGGTEAAQMVLERLPPTSRTAVEGKTPVLFAGFGFTKS